MAAGYIFTRMKVSEVGNPGKGGYFYHLANAWWPITIDEDGDPCVVFYGRPRSPYSSPQCNANRLIAERFRSHIPYTMEEHAVQIEMAYQPINISDY